MQTYCPRIIMIGQVQISGGKPDRQVFFQNALLNIYQADNNLFGFTYYKDKGFWDVFNGDPIYLSPEIAIRYAKLYTIESIVRHDTENSKIAVDFRSDKVLHQNQLSKRTLGRVQGYGVNELYINQCDRANIRNKLQENGKMRNLVHLQNLDGKQINGILEAELIPIDSNTLLSIETFRLDWDSRFH